MRTKAICITLFILASGPLGGCAAVVMRPPKSWDPSVLPRCSEGRGAVVLDGVMATITGLAGLAATANSEAKIGIPLLLWGSVHAISAVAGNGSASRCTKALERHQEWQAQRWQKSPSVAAPPAPPPAQHDPPPAATAPSATPLTLRPRQQQRSIPGLILGHGEWADFWREVTQ